jgi:hypothetical protein
VFDVRRRVLTCHIGDGPGETEKRERDLQLGRLENRQDESECRGDLRKWSARALGLGQWGLVSTHRGCTEDTADCPEHEVGVLIGHERYDQVGPDEASAGGPSDWSR